MGEVRRTTREALHGARVGLAGEKGQGLVEYALILLLVATALVGGLGAFQAQLSTGYANIANAIP